MQEYSAAYGRRPKELSPAAIGVLLRYPWPGNVRELENAVQRAVVMAEGQTIETWHLPKSLNSGFEQPAEVRSYEEEVREFKRRLILRTLRECGGRKVDAARALGVARGYLHRLINQLQIQLDDDDFEIAPADGPTPQERIM